MKPVLKLPSENSYYPVAFIADKIFSEKYGTCIRRFENLGQVVADPVSGQLCVSAQFLLRYEEFRHYLSGKRKKILDDPTTDFRKTLPLDICSDFVSRRDLSTQLPLCHNTIRTKEQLLRALAYGEWRTVKVGSSVNFALYDFLEEDSWASPAEISWRTGSKIIGGILIQLTKATVSSPQQDVNHLNTASEICLKGDDSVLQNDPVLAPADPLFDPEKGLPEQEIVGVQTGEILVPKVDRKRTVKGRLALDARTRAPGSVYMAPGTAMPLSETIKYNGKWKKFSWDTWQTTMPVGLNGLPYIEAIHPEVLIRAAEEAQTWARCLREQRTGLERATGAWDPAEFQEVLAKTQASIYNNREGWLFGDLNPLMPPDHVFLF